VALKVEDGSKRAAEPAILAVLKNIGAISSSELVHLSKYALPKILNTRQETVGHVRTSLQI
jgi:L-asparaginase II